MPFSKLNYVLTREDGRLASTTVNDIDEMFKALGQQQRIVLHFHGGVVNEQLGFEFAKLLYPVYTDAGAYPIFFIWRSGLLETVRGNLQEILAERLFTRVLRWVTRHTLGRRGPSPGRRAAGVLATPRAEEVADELSRHRLGQEPYAGVVIPADVEPLTSVERAELQAQLATDDELEAQHRAIVDSLSAVPQAESTRARGIAARIPTLMPPDVRANLVDRANLANMYVKVLEAVIQRFRDQTDHGFYPTVVEETLRAFYLGNVGTDIWNAMKKDTKDTFAKSPEVRGGRYFLDRLADLLDTDKRPQVSLVGHSAGAVFIDNLLSDVLEKRARYAFPSDFRFHNVVFLAPACTFAHCAPVIRRHADLMDRFRMFTMTDAAEQADWLLPAYPRSLLYFISGVLERDPKGRSAVTPLVGMQRSYTNPAVATDPGGVAIRDFVKTSDRVVWSPEDRGPGLASGAHTHFMYDADSQLQASLRWLIQH
jgi:hypothetical protein